MSITAADIQNQSFSIDRKGYDVDEVDVFLEHVADEIDLLNQQVANLQNQLADTAQALAEAQAANEAAAQEQTAYLDLDDEPDFEDDAEDDGEQDDDQDSDDSDSDEDAAALIAEYKSKIAALRKQLAEKSANDNAISQALIVAQRSADDIVDKAHAEADQIIKDANADAERIRDKAEADRQRVLEATRKLEEERESVRAGYRDMLNNFIDDAEAKLNSIDEDYRKTAHAEHSQIPSINQPATAQAGAAAYHVPTNINIPGGNNQANAVPSPASFVEKDLTGFGDADDDFDFDDPD